MIESYDEETRSQKLSRTAKVSCTSKKTIPILIPILLALLLITIALLIAVNIYYYLIKYQAERTELLPFHNTNNGLTENTYW